MQQLSQLDSSYWLDTPLSRFPALERDIDVDVTVVGGGLTGITTAYLLSKKGVRVALLDRHTLASADTGHSTAHLTYVTDDRLRDLVKRWGRDGARALWRAGMEAIDHVEQIAVDTGSNCDFRRVPGFLHESRRIDRSHFSTEAARLKEDAQLGRELGFDAQFLEDVPYALRPGVRFEHQAKFHPRKYLQGLLQAISECGGYVFEHTTLDSIESQSCTVRANGRRIRCDYVVIATHSPLLCDNALQGLDPLRKKLSLYTSFVLGAYLPLGTVPEALFWDTFDPYDHLRIDAKADRLYAIFGGEDAKSNEAVDVETAFGKLRARLLSALPDADIDRRWHGQVVVTDDGLPFIGEFADRIFIATGFCGNGFTFGTLSAAMATDRFLGKDNRWFDLFRVDRDAFHGGLWREQLKS
ncbi:MAG TPA: FAD-binding oxidoreductase [Steroidobacteraceae bacterium]|nr:FAD-binding oxidoreductase [Steroidobacteraceae bacterium]